MPTTTLLVQLQQQQQQQQQYQLATVAGHDCCDADQIHNLHNLHNQTALYIISEHDYYVRSLIPAKTKPSSSSPSPSPDSVHSHRFQTPLQRFISHKKPARPLMATFSYGPDENMGPVALGGPPGSPPDLTNSKSSKSSSLHSSSLSDIMGPNDLSHFEDINLDDLQGALGPSSFPMHPSYSSVSNRLHFEVSNPRMSGSSSRSMPYPSSSQHSFRDLTAGSKPRYPSLKGQVNGAVRQQPNSHLHAGGRQMRRGFTSPSAPSLANITNLAAPGRRSRSPSPSNPPRLPSSSRTLSRRSSRNLDVSISPSVANRRQSWQHTSRKTVKELEAECDDEDDDLPDDAHLWGVPISPRPAQERSPAPSICGSPPQSLPSPLTSIAPSSRSNSASMRVSPGASPKQVDQPLSPSIENIENIPPHHLSRHRTNTWENTYGTLDEESRKMTEKLEEYVTELEKVQEVKRQQPGLSRSSSLERTSPKAVKSLPPLRKSDPLIDPLQPSSEKTKYLSRTRPSWLPPKDPKEEKKHLKEYQKMQDRIEQAERIAAEKVQHEQLARETAERKKAEVWEDLLPKWDTETATYEGKKIYRKLWWNGIPPKYRGVVWKKALGNELEITEITYNIALEKAKMQIEALGDAAFDGKVTTIIQNTLDVFPELKMFGPKTHTSEEQPFHRDLVNVCLAYMLYRPDVDTLTGVHHIAGLFLLNMSAPDAFICLGNLLNRHLPLSFLLQDLPAMTTAYDITLSALHKKAPSLARHLADLRVEPRDYLRPMFSSLFCDRLSIEHAARVMDLYTIEGDKIPPRVAVAVLGILEGQLYQGGAQDIVEGLNDKNCSKQMSAEDFSGRVYEAGKNGSPPA